MISEFFPISKKVSLVTRGVDTSEFFPNEPKIDIRKKYNLKASDRIVICVANLVPVKGVEVLLKAFESVKNIYQDWKLIVVGDVENDYGKMLVKAGKTMILKKELFLQVKY